MRDFKEKAQIIGGVILLAAMIFIALFVVVFRIMVFTKYADTPIKDVPAWAYWIMQDGGGK